MYSAAVAQQVTNYETQWLRQELKEWLFVIIHAFNQTLELSLSQALFHVFKRYTGPKIIRLVRIN